MLRVRVKQQYQETTYYAYRTPYIIFWKKASKLVMASWKSGFELIVNKNNMIPVNSVETAIVYFRPMYLTSTVYAAIMEPGTPIIEVIP